MCIQRRDTPKSPSELNRVWIVQRDGDNVPLYWSRDKQKCMDFAAARMGDSNPDWVTPNMGYYGRGRRSLVVTYHTRPHLLRVGRPVPG